MKKYAVLFLVMALSGAYATPAAAIDTNDISLIKLDTDSRSAKSGGSIMLKRNADLGQAAAQRKCVTRVITVGLPDKEGRIIL